MIFIIHIRVHTHIKNFRNTDRLTETVVASTLLAHGQMTSRRRPLFSNTFRNVSHVATDPAAKLVNTHSDVLTQSLNGRTINNKESYQFYSNGDSNKNRNEDCNVKKGKADHA